MTRQRCCCNCRRNIRTGGISSVICRCSVDNHVIGYVETFEGWCKRWAPEPAGKWANITNDGTYETAESKEYLGAEKR